jgi:hypothetical protein
MGINTNHCNGWGSVDDRLLAPINVNMPMSSTKTGLIQKLATWLSECMWAPYNQAHNNNVKIILLEKGRNESY